MFRSLAAFALPLLALPLLVVTAAAQAPSGGRTVTATGVTKPPGRAGAPFSRASTEADMAKAQRAAATRDKAWDAKMRTTMGSICKGC
ncbi:hypothetical protein PMNALOAF_1652 [Methylobacterium adhaesivum]|jgi:hypothetical protein|uniref:Uncharacterized protein n=1 Tax=Methylobacterium adhaesivum TaxID=333297 RepID=A0ABT8BDL0_9HYPH|nr:hypothetical protein [Methylobacterium adhaesivum]MDN3589388.1 hypothetical protein [Methylobacterium adhaesivum]GJD30405.1 hypothetical protein PMNALOAF_1652 [Methylobacterium adhaesivum]